MANSNLYLSNLCWRPQDLLNVIRLIKKYKFKGIDYAPVQYCKNWAHVEKKSIILKSILVKKNIKVNALQGIFYKKNLIFLRTL